jgi:hypothetical protein
MKLSCGFLQNVEGKPRTVLVISVDGLPVKPRGEQTLPGNHTDENQLKKTRFRKQVPFAAEF